MKIRGVLLSAGSKWNDGAWERWATVRSDGPVDYTVPMAEAGDHSRLISRVVDWEGGVLTEVKPIEVIRDEAVAAHVARLRELFEHMPIEARAAVVCALAEPLRGHE